MTNQEQAPVKDQSAPAPELKRLDVLVGTWDLKGRTLDSQEDNITGWSIFEWLPGGHFMKVTGEITLKDFHVQSQELITYDPVSQTFPSHVYSNLSAEVGQYHWDVKGNQVTHWEDTSKYTGSFSADGQTLSGAWRPNLGEEVTDGSAYDAVMTRVKAGRQSM